MAIAYMHSGQKFEWNGAIYQLDRQLDNEWQYVNINTNKSNQITLDGFYEKYASGEIRFQTRKHEFIPEVIKQKNGEKIVAQLVLLPESVQELMKSRRIFIESILKSYGDTRSQKHLYDAIQKLWNEVWGKKPSPATVARWIKRYIESDKDIRALGPSNFLKGNRRERYPLEVREFCINSIGRVYLQLTRGSINKTLEEAKRLIRNENTLRPDGYKLAYPKNSYIRALIAQIPEFDKYHKRYGANAAMHKFRNAVNSVICNKPLERVEIDHTQLDIVLVDTITGVVIGRPWLTVAVDVYTRAILGFQLSYDPPSHMTVARVLKMALLPKAYAERWPSVKGAWVMFGLMVDLIVDNGYEFHSSSLESACYELGINISFCPRKQSWWKAHIERLIGTLNRALTDGMPGRTFANITEKANYDAVGHAAISLKTMEEMIAKWIVDIYHEQTHSELGMKPREAWEQSIRNEDIPLVANAEVLNAVVGVVSKRTLTHKGIEINNLLYNSDELEVIWKQYGKLNKVTIKWDPENLSSIQLYTPDGKMLCIPVIPKYEQYATELTYYRHQANKAYSKKYLEDKDDDEALSIAHAEIQELAQQDMFSKSKKTRVQTKRLLNMDAHLPKALPNTPQKDMPSNIPSIGSQTSRKKFDATVSQRKQNKGY